MNVMITGMGAVSAFGPGLAPLWDAARAGRSACAPIAYEREVPHQISIAAQYQEFVPASFLSESQCAVYDRFTAFAVLAAAEAVAQAQLMPDRVRGPRTAVIIGTGVGGVGSLDDGCYQLYAQARARLNPMTIPRVMANAAACHVSMQHGTRGPTFAVSSACASGAQAIGIGADLVRAGVVDIAIVGGSEAPLTPAVMRGWETMRVLAPQACRPFSHGRNGMVLGEGAAVFVLESEAQVRERGVEPLARLAGYGTSSDAGDLLRPDANGAAAAMRLALANAGVSRNAIDYVNAHGTGTVLNDMTETVAIKNVFGQRARSMPVTSTKPVHGHALGAAGALELAVTISALREGFVPPTLNWLDADPACDLDVVPNAGRACEIGYALSNSFAFGGINACLLVGRA
jgi:nodulation protein E